MRIYMCKVCDGRGYSPSYASDDEHDFLDSEIRPWGRKECPMCKGTGYCTRKDTEACAS